MDDSKLNDLKLDIYYTNIKRILNFVEDWKFEFYLTNMPGIKPETTKNNYEKVRWIFKNQNKIELIIKIYSNDYIKTLEKELNRVNCKIKTIKMSNQNHKVIIREKNLFDLFM